MKENNTFCSVIVTYNRLDKLKKAINSYAEQTYPISKMIIVNNNSTDGTRFFLEEIQNNYPFEITIINTDENIGGAGGFAIGIERSLQSDCDFIFIADDDAYLDKKAIEELNRAIVLNNDCRAFCSRVVFPDGDIQMLHRRRIIKRFWSIDDIPIASEEYNSDTMYVDLYSFVGVCLNKSLIKEIGLPSTEYFIQYDDTDYSFRTKTFSKTICVTRSTVIHDVIKQSQSIEEVNWKTYYAIRNRLLVIRNFFSWRYFIIAFIRCYFGSIKIRNKQLRIIRRKAALDALKNKKGKNKRYLPVAF